MTLPVSIAHDESSTYKPCEILQIKRIGAIQEALAKQLLDKAIYEKLPPLQAPDDDD